MYILTYKKCRKTNKIFYRIPTFYFTIYTEIVGKYLSGKYSYATLADEYGISWNTIHTMVRKYRNTGTTISAQKGRPKEKDLTREDYKERYEILKKYQAFLKAQRERK